ncbi:MAG: conjugative transfer ATPase [Candidatus Thiodiazotropha weberae]|nr:conjugative transfer ATPase [Candidatus Thiodiazotropha weberae]
MSNLLYETTGQDQDAQNEHAEEFASVREKSIEGGFTLLKRLIGLYPLKGDIPLETRDSDLLLKKRASRTLPAKSFLSFVPFRWYDPEYEQFVCADRRRRGLVFELIPADVEGRNDEIIDEMADKLTTALQALPGKEPAWMLQIYMQDEPVAAQVHRLRSYMVEHSPSNRQVFNEELQDTKLHPYSEAWLEIMDEHLKLTSRQQGIFRDDMVGGTAWRARARTVRCVLTKAPGSKVDPDDLNGVLERFRQTLVEGGVKIHLLDGESLRDWLLPWYTGDGIDAYQWIEKNPYPKEDEATGELPPEWDLGEACIRGRLSLADECNFCWRHGDQFNRFVTLQPLRHKPRAGVWTRETTGGQSSPFDRLPDGSILAITIVFDAQDLIDERISKLLTVSIGDGADASLTAEECKLSQSWIAKGHRMISVCSGVYLSADSIEDLELNTNKVVAACSSAGFDAIEPGDDLLSIDTYVRMLPFSWNPKVDRKFIRRGRLQWDSHLSRIVPFLGRGTGTGHPGIFAFNRIGVPLTFDPLNSQDRSKNAHMLVLGPTGSGKTATLVSMLMHTMAVHRPRLFLITALPTFGLLGAWFERHGFSVLHKHIKKSEDISLPPFADITELAKDDEIDQASEQSERDILGEAVLAAKLMITGGRKQDEEALKQEDITMIGSAIIKAGKKAAAEDRQALTEDVVQAFRDLSQGEGNYTHNQCEKMLGMAVAMEKYTQHWDGQLFNRPGENWPDVDVTIVELGMLARTGYESQLALAMTGLMGRINDRVEHNQYSGRPNITLIDEAHLLIQNPLVGPYINKISAMWRTFGGWLWIATQNLRQIPESSKQLLNQPEWWLALSSDQDEVDEISKFKDLSPEEKTLLKQARKEPGKYVEGVVMSKKLLSLFRNVPPTLALAIAQTEQNEKQQRHQIMKELGLSEELDAAIEIAKRIEAGRREFRL